MNRAVSLPVVAALALAACADPVGVPVAQRAIVTRPGSVAPAINTTPTGVPQGTQSAVFPSTNLINQGNAWAHVLFVSEGVQQVTLNFVSTRAFYSCFEYRIDDEAPTSTANGGNNWNPLITDGMWTYTCRNNNSQQITFTAVDHVDVRMGFGAESDERFDWTRFYVVPLDKDACMNGGWEALGFSNQGQCVRFVETGKDSRTSG